MKLGQAIKMAWKSIAANKGRSALTMLGIIIGIASVMTIVSTINGMNQKTMEQFEAMGRNRISLYVYSYMYDENGNSSMPDVYNDLYDYCARLDDYVLGITPSGYVYDATVVYGTVSSANMAYNWDENGNLTGPTPPQVRLGNDQFSVCSNFTLDHGRDLAVLDVKNYNQVCVLGAEAAKNFFNYVDPVGKTIQIKNQEFEVVGVYAAKDESTVSGQDNIIVVPFTCRRVLGVQEINEYLIKAKSSDTAVEAVSRINGFLSGFINPAQGGWSISSENEWQDSSGEWAAQMSLVLGGIAAISLLVGGIGIMNIMLVTVTERTREIGIRRAIGAQRSSIVVQFLIEAAMLCGIGGVFGILIGIGGTRIAGRLLMDMDIWPSMSISLAALLLSVVLGVLFGIYPAAKASGLQPVEALRAE